MAGGGKILRQSMALLTLLGESGAGVSQMRLVCSHCRRRRCGFTIQAARRRDIGEIGGIAAKIAMTGIASFRSAWLGVAGQTGVVDLRRAIVLAMAAFAGAEIIGNAFNETTVLTHPAGRMRKSGVAGFARNLGGAATVIVAMTRLAFCGIELLISQKFAVKICGTPLQPTLKMRETSMTGSARNFGGAAIIIAAVTRLTGCSIVLHGCQRLAMEIRRDQIAPALTMRETGVAVLAQPRLIFYKPSIILAAVTLPALIGVKLLRR